MDISEDEFWMMLPREFDRRLRVHDRRTERASDDHWDRTLMIVNHLRGLMRMQAKRGAGLKVITLESLKKRSRLASGEDAPTPAEMQADFDELDRARANRKG